MDLSCSSSSSTCLSMTAGSVPDIQEKSSRWTDWPRRVFSDIPQELTQSFGQRCFVWVCDAAGDAGGAGDAAGDAGGDATGLRGV